MRWGQVCLGVIAAGFLFTGTAAAQGFNQVLSTKHNILPEGPGSDLDRVCGSCHIEDIEEENIPLWDSERIVSSFPVKFRVDPPVGKGDTETKPFGPSFTCLTCHDGVLGNNVHQLGFSGSGPDKDSGPVVDLGTGLRLTDHPDSILYPREPDGRLSGDRADPRLARYWSIPDRDDIGVILPTGPQSSALNLQEIDLDDPLAVSGLVRTFMGIVHCDTCHNPHDDGVRPFLRVPHKTLCLVCHDR